mmetsp:Transcript_115285/g.333026  ORF Transcript_115285/g.333026 Transcript_115285/m.333026 type:complete len:231 (+) Transcript_115285:756-1448(+)
MELHLHALELRGSVHAGVLLVLTCEPVAVDVAPHAATQSEVAQDAPALVEPPAPADDEHVLRLQVAVDEAPGLHVQYALDDVAEHPELQDAHPHRGIQELRLLKFAEPLPEVVVRMLHEEPINLVHRAEVVHLDNPRNLGRRGRVHPPPHLVLVREVELVTDAQRPLHRDPPGGPAPARPSGALSVKRGDTTRGAMPHMALVHEQRLPSVRALLVQLHGPVMFRSLQVGL